MPQNMSAMRSPGCGSRKPSARHHHRIDLRVHLGEFGGVVRHFHAVLRQAVGQARCIQRVDGVTGVRAAGLQPDLYRAIGLAVGVGKLLQQLFIGGIDGIHIAEYQTSTLSPTATSTCGMRLLIDSLAIMRAAA
jgi:hypothetical protein